MCVSDGFGVAGGEQACLAPQPASPPGLVGALEHLDDISGVEPQLVRVLGVEVVQSSDLSAGGRFVLDTEEDVQNVSVTF